ncbi:MAG TPA: quinone oxidoreductase, partial [Anaerolineales bacterium]|nr:quinone oxidoreductase [Anaerolineales bacterium]
PADKAIRVPKAISSQHAAAIMLQGITAHYLAKSTYPLRNGDTALIHAAAGGVGQLLVQIAKMCGARVIATTSSEEKAQIAKEIGADEVIIRSRIDFAEEVKRLTDGNGVDVVYDGVGQKTFLKGLDSLKPRGMMVLFGQASGKVEPLDPQVLNQKGSLYLTRPSIGPYLHPRTEFLWRATDLFDWVAKGSLAIKLDKTFPLEQAADAHRYMEEGKTMGKVLLLT